MCGAPIHKFPPECISFLTGSRDGYTFCSTAHGILTCPGRYPVDNAPTGEQNQYLNYAKQQVQHNEALQIAPRGIDADLLEAQLPEEDTGGYGEMDITTEAELENSDAEERTMYAGSVSLTIDGPSPKKAKTGDKDAEIAALKKELEGAKAKPEAGNSAQPVVRKVCISRLYYLLLMHGSCLKRFKFY